LFLTIDPCSDISQIRNPLAVVMRCTNMLSQALLETKLLLAKCHSSGATSKDKNSRENRLDSLVKNTVDTVETIVSCATDQERITDDILSLSKLDSNLLEICSSIWKVDGFLQQIDSTLKIEAALKGQAGGGTVSEVS
jgi:signal transduction histidine kinase